MEGLAALAEHLNVTVIPAHALLGMFSETLSGLSAEKKFCSINFAFFFSYVMFKKRAGVFYRV